MVACILAGDSLEEGRAVLIKDHVPAAWELAQKALLTTPQSALAHEFAGEVLFRRADIPAAESEFKNAIALDGKTARAWWGLGRVFQCSSMKKSAQVYFERAHALDPEDPEVFLSWTNTLHGKDHVEALRRYLSMNDPTLDDEGLTSMKMHLARDEQLIGHKVARLASEYERTELSLYPVYNGRNRVRGFSLHVSINGIKSLRLLVDTGASGILVNTKEGNKLGLSNLSDAIFSGIGDDRKHQTARVGIAERVMMGKVEFADYPIEVSDRKFEEDCDGLIGTEVFSDFLVTLDFTARKVRLEPLPNHRPDDEGPFNREITENLKGFAPVFRFGHHLLISTRVNDSRPVLFLLDTGAAHTIISNEFAAEVTKVRRDAETVVHGVTGRVKEVYTANEFLLQFANFRQRNLDTLSFDLSKQSKRMGTEMSGIIGLQLLALFTVTIDYRDGLVHFDYHPR
jgi:predicted aspartyl protease